MAAGLVLRCWSVLELVSGAALTGIAAIPIRGSAGIRSCLRSPAPWTDRRLLVPVRSAWAWTAALLPLAQVQTAERCRSCSQSVAGKHLLSHGFPDTGLLPAAPAVRIVVDRRHNRPAVGTVLLLVHPLQIRPCPTILLIGHVQPQRCGEDTLHHSSPVFRRRSVARSS